MCQNYLLFYVCMYIQHLWKLCVPKVTQTWKNMIKNSIVLHFRWDCAVKSTNVRLGERNRTTVSRGSSCREGRGAEMGLTEPA